MQEMSSRATTEEPSTGLQTGWNGRVIGYVAILMLVNVMVDTVVTAPSFIIAQLKDAFQTTHFAWLDMSAMLAGAMWSPLLGKAADIHGKRRILVFTLLVAALGGIVCLIAPNLAVFVLGRALQGAAVASLFLTVALIRDVCASRFAMVVTGVVTSGSAAFGIVTPFVLQIATAAFGWRFVFVVAAGFAAVGALCVRLAIPNSAVRTPGRLDVAGALVLGGGLAGVLMYISLGQDLGWLGILPLAVLAAGVVALLVWFLVLSRAPEPVIDIRAITPTLGLGFLVVTMGTGAYRSMLSLFGLLVDVAPEDGLGYGIAGPAALGLMFGVPSFGITLGGILAGAVATRVGPAWPLAAGLVTGTTAALVMFVAGSGNLAIAAVCSFMLSLTAGSMVTSGFNLASLLTSPEKQGTISSVVMVMIAIGSVMMSFIGTAILNSTDMVVGGETVNSSLGVHTYIAVGGCAFVLAAIPMTLLIRRMRRSGVTGGPAVRG
ncbi:MFS transporter [Thermopolyspora sp. NPDC052614]|uniref:MFS transporter n=1 Tax=Thermopolyspora sp. NPDC052614 TaxID=3155682 RepID=UPI00343C3868